MQEIWRSLSTELPSQAQELCACLPLAPLERGTEQTPAQENFLPVAAPLKNMLQAALTSLLPDSASLSLLLLHIVQFKPVQLPPSSSVIFQRTGYHAPASLQAQLLHNIRRTLRTSDLILADEQGTGAVFLFPQVDQEGITHIAARISRTINLLQAETIVPPLQYETEISTGFTSYPNPASSLEALLSLAGQIQERITFRPAVIPHNERPRTRVKRSPDASRVSTLDTRLLEARACGIPFMQIPSRLPTRLKQLVPHSLALQLRCAPVGRNHNQLTVAMANPTDAQALRSLSETTGMLIFPVSCEIAALDILLASGW